MRLFEDDALIYCEINTVDDTKIFQKDLEALFKWGADWQMASTLTNASLCTSHPQSHQVLHLTSFVETLFKWHHATQILASILAATSNGILTLILNVTRSSKRSLWVIRWNFKAGTPDVKSDSTYLSSNLNWSMALQLGISGVTGGGGGRGAECPLESSDPEIKRQGKAGGGELRRKLLKGRQKIENKPLKFVLGLPKWKFSTRKIHFTLGKKSGKMTLPPQKTFPVTSLLGILAPKKKNISLIWFKDWLQDCVLMTTPASPACLPWSHLSSGLALRPDIRCWH